MNLFDLHFSEKTVRVRTRRYELPRDYLPLGPQNTSGNTLQPVFLRLIRSIASVFTVATLSSSTQLIAVQLHQLGANPVRTVFALWPKLIGPQPSI